MVSLTTESLESREETTLNRLQAEVDAKPDFDTQVQAAKSFWNNRINNAAFREIRAVLLRMCVGVEICNYCENNEATDIEHILPKTFFPQAAFRWENYLLACKTCNSGYKLDKLAVFFPENSCTRQDVQRGTEPPSQESLMLNPRAENPLDFLSLSLETGIFLESHPDHASCEFQRASYTLEVLKLNDREALRAARWRACQQIFQTLSTAAAIQEAIDFGELDAIINASQPFINLDHTKPFSDLQREQLDHIKASLQKRPHPTVWEEIKRQQAKIPRFAALFTRFPEAHSW